MKRKKSVTLAAGRGAREGRGASEGKGAKKGRGANEGRSEARIKFIVCAEDRSNCI